MFEKHTKKLFLIDACIVLVVLIILVVMILRFVKVPYTISEITEKTYPYNETVYYNETEEVEIQVPYQTEEQYTYTKDIAPPSSGLEPKPSFLPDKNCRLEDYNYTLNYFGTITEKNRYDPVTKIGYYNGAVRQGVEICNHEKRRMNTNLYICHYNGNTKADCNDRLVTTVRANICEKRTLVWVTSFGENKHITLEKGSVSQKLVCDASIMPGNDGAVSPPAVYYNVAGTDFSQYAQGTRVMTQSGTLADKRLSSDLLRDEVTSAQVHGTRLVTKYRTGTVTKQIPKNMTVVKYKTEREQREITKYRPLWEEVKILLNLNI